MLKYSEKNGIIVVNDPSALTWGRYDVKTKTIYICGEYVKGGMTNDEIADVIKKLGFAKETIIADCSEQKSIEEIRRFGVPRIKPCAKGKDSIINGIDKILRNRLVVDERCTRMIEELENYTWQKDKSTGEYINKPVDKWNHCADSVRYGISTIIGKKTGWKV